MSSDLLDMRVIEDVDSPYSDPDVLKPASLHFIELAEGGCKCTSGRLMDELAEFIETSRYSPTVVFGPT